MSIAHFPFFFYFLILFLCFLFPYFYFSILLFFFLFLIFSPLFSPIHSSVPLSLDLALPASSTSQPRGFQRRRMPHPLRNLEASSVAPFPTSIYSPAAAVLPRRPSPLRTATFPRAAEPLTDKL
jgi:hypothetical protein